MRHSCKTQIIISPKAVNENTSVELYRKGS